MTKLIFLGCLSDTKYKETCESAKKVIKMIDSEYKVIENAPCCGSLLFHTASEEEIKNHTQSVSDWMKSNEVTDIITICAGCYRYLTTEYKEFLPEFNIRVRHLIDVIAQPENLDKLNLKNNGKKLVVAYHDACHLKNAATPLLEQPRKLLGSIENIQFKEMENKEKLSVCCGSGGGVYSAFKENSDYNSNYIFEQARKARAKLLLTGCPFCFTALNRIKEENKKIRFPVMKMEDFLSKIIDGVDIV